ncbi:unnamed protein product, partial [marine sediment metagenome]
MSEKKQKEQIENLEEFAGKTASIMDKRLAFIP